MLLQFYSGINIQTAANPITPVVIPLMTCKYRGTIDLAVNNKVPAKNFKELMTYAKSLPNPMVFGPTGQGSSTHLAGELLALRTGMKLQHIPYKGGGQAVTDVAAGQLVPIGYLRLCVD